MAQVAAAEKAYIYRLPLELLEFVLDGLDKKELKALRLTSKYYEKLAVPRLFQHYALYPHVRSFERLVNISKTRHLQHYVQHLSFDGSCLGLLDRVVKRIKSVWSRHIDEDQKKKLLDHAATLESQDLNADLQIDSITQILFLVDAFKGLTKLKHISLTDSQHDSPYSVLLWEDLPEFYKAIIRETCGCHRHFHLEPGPIGLSSHRIGSSGRVMLTTLHRLSNPIESLCFSGPHFERLLIGGVFEKRNHIFERPFASLKSLELRSTTSQYFTNPAAMKNLQYMLKTAQNLEHLALEFRTLTYLQLEGRYLMDNSYGSTAESMFGVRGSQYMPPEGRIGQPFSLQPRLNWSPKLHQLDLHGAVCTAKELKSILKHCASSLKLLSLKNLILLPEDRDGPQACLVAMLKWIQSKMRLEDVRLDGWLTSGNMQTWAINRKPLENDRDLLLAHVERFVVSGGPCPLEHVAIEPGNFDLTGKSRLKHVPEVLDEPKYAGDSTFHMQYESDPDVSDEDEDEDELDMDDYDIWDEMEDDMEDDMEDESDFSDDFGFVPPSGLPSLPALLSGIVPAPPPTQMPPLAAPLLDAPSPD